MFCEFKIWLIIISHATKLLVGYIGLTLSVCLSIQPASLHAMSTVTFKFLDRLFPYWAQMITSINGCVKHNDLWAWPISSRSFSLDFGIKLWKFVFWSALKLIQFQMNSFHIWHKPSLPWEGVLCLMTYHLDYTLRVIQQWFCNNTIKIWYILSCLLYSMYNYGWILSIFGINDR